MSRASALTPQGWQHARRNALLFVVILLEGGNDGDLAGEVPEFDIDDMGGIERRRVAHLEGAIAALNDALPDGHPCKVTRALLERLHLAASPIGDDYSGDVWLDDLADALATYLPPPDL